MADEISDLLESQKGRRLAIKLRTGRVVTGVLRDFDIHMSMTIDSVRETSSEDGGPQGDGEVMSSVLLRGDNIVMISMPDDEDDNGSGESDEGKDVDSSGGSEGKGNGDNGSLDAAPADNDDNSADMSRDGA